MREKITKGISLVVILASAIASIICFRYTFITTYVPDLGLTYAEIFMLPAEIFLLTTIELIVLYVLIFHRRKTFET